MITRFAPSPTGPLHLGHAYSALTVWKVAAQLGGTALLRIEDTDSTRVRPEHEAGIYQDLAWLGLSWPEPATILVARICFKVICYLLLLLLIVFIFCCCFVFF